MAPPQLSAKFWMTTLIVAGVGSSLEWFDFYIFTQLNATITKVFFPESDGAAAALSYWAVFAAGFVVRPIGALVFGHVGDATGRNKSLTLSIFVIAIATIIIGCLPGYATPHGYSIGIAAPIILAILRIVQGLALGGEYCVAVIYVSELAPVKSRGMLVAALMCSVNIGLIAATAFVMVLNHLVPADKMLIWGWRIPFLCAAFTCFLAYYIRQGMPEPGAVAEARKRMRHALPSTTDAPVKDLAADVASPDQLDVSAAISTGGTFADVVKVEGEEQEEEEGAYVRSSYKPIKLPLVRVIRHNFLGLIFHVLYVAWVSGAFYAAVSWNAVHMKELGMPTVMTQAVMVVSLIPNAIGVLLVGYILDRGVKALWGNLLVVLIGIPLAFGVFHGVGASAAASYTLVSLFHLVVGAAMGFAVLPVSRIYNPLERTTGFSFGYNLGYGVLGGCSPLIITSIEYGLPVGRKELAPSVWLLGLGLLSVAGVFALRMYKPRLNMPHVSRLS